MNLKRTAFSIQNKKLRDIDYAKNYPTISDLIREQNVSNNQVEITVHRRRDLDSLGEFIKVNP
tara:strand:- start:136 stop:324 length:189 start_codon:yes stop_codon:yes gene_type:complete